MLLDGYLPGGHLADPLVRTHARQKKTSKNGQILAQQGL